MQSKDTVFQLKVNVVTGVTQGSTMTITGMDLSDGDVLLSVIAIDGDNGDLATTVQDKTANHSISADNTLKNDSGGNLSTFRLIVLWIDRSAA